MSGDRLYPIILVRIRRQGSQTALRVVDDQSPAEPGEDVIRAKVLSLVYTDDEKAADTLKLTIDNFNLDYFDAPFCKPGDLIKAKFGYPGNMSGKIETVITKVKSQGTTITVESNGKEYLLNTIVRPRVWRNKKRSDVVRAIADEYGYAANAEIHDTEIVYPQITQAKLTDHQLIVEMAKREGWIFYIDANGFYFGPRPLDKAPLKTIRYYLAAEGGDLMSFPTIESDLFARPGAVTAKGSDPKTGKEFKVTGNNDSTKGRPTLSKTTEVVDRKDGEASHQTAVATETTVATTATTKAAAQRVVNAIYTNAQLGAVKMGLSLVGDPAYRAKAVFAISDVGKQLAGKVYFTQVTHTIGPSSYTVSAKARREAFNNAGAAQKAASKGAANDKAAPAPGAAKTDKLEGHEKVDHKSGETRVEYR